MPVARFQMPDGRVGRFEVPEGTTPEQAQELIGQMLASQPQATEQPVEEQPNPTEGMSTGEKIAAGAGKAITDLGRGAKQILSNVPVLNQLDALNPETVQAEIDESRRLDAPLMDTAAGKVGNVAGLVGASLLVPGAATATGATALGAGMGALQPTSGDESRATNTAIGAAAGRVGKWAGDKVGAWLSNRLAQKTAQVAERQSQDQVRNATLSAAQAEGLVVTPSQAGAGIGSRLAEGLSGKAKTEQLAVIKNQSRIDDLARRAVGLPKDAPLTSEAMQGLRNTAFNSGYEPIKQVGIIATDKAYSNTLDKIVSKYTGAARSFPNAAKNEIADLVDAYRVRFFDSSDALDAIKILREDASAAFRSGDGALGRASKEVAKALEDKIERQLSTQGKEGAQLLKNFRDARVLMAKAHTLEDAIQEGSGMVNPQKLASMLQRGDKLTGELELIAKFANSFKKVARLPESGYANPLTAVDFGYAGLGAGVNPMIAALPAARVASRYSILSKPYQEALVHPTYSGNTLASIASRSANSRLTQSALPGVAAGVTLDRRKK